MSDTQHSIIREHNHNESKSDILARVANTNDFMIISDVFKQLGDPTRIRIYWLLCHCEECVSSIAGILNITSPAVSHHLRVLKDCGLINATRHGKEVYYKVSDSIQSRLMHEIIEQIMDITCPEPPNQAVEYESSPTATIYKVHDYLLNNLDTHITIDALSKQFHINPTTLKATFKAIYGDSLAAHIKRHKIEKAASYLLTTDLSSSEISNMIGYESPSKFTSAFKEVFGTTPKVYRDTHKQL